MSDLTTSIARMAERYRMVVDPAAGNNAHSAAIRMVGQGRRVLEVGCSVGHVTEQLVAAGNRVVGIELDPAAAEEARRHADEVHVADLDHTPLGEVVTGPFDVALFGDVLEHFRDPQRVLSAGVDLLAPDGRVVISVPNVAHVDVRLMLLSGRWDYRTDGLLDETHLRFFTRDGLRRLLAGSGLVATSVERVTVGVYGSNLGVEPGLFPDTVVRWALADPEALTFQFVVTAERSGVDVLAGDPPRYDRSLLDTDALADVATDLRQVLDEQRTHNAALQTELDAWRNSTLARISRPLRTAWAPLARRIRRDG